MVAWDTGWVLFLGSKALWYSAYLGEKFLVKRWTIVKVEALAFVSLLVWKLTSTGRGTELGVSSFQVPGVAQSRLSTASALLLF